MLPSALSGVPAVVVLQLPGPDGEPAVLLELGLLASSEVLSCASGALVTGPAVSAETDVLRLDAASVRWLCWTSLNPPLAGAGSAL